MERTTVDSKRFDGLARTVADRGAERTRDRDQFEALTRLVATKGSRRVALAGLLGVVLQGVGPQLTAAQCRGKEGKNKRQCRRQEREDEDKEKAPKGGTCLGLNQLCSIFGGAPCCDYGQSEKWNRTRCTSGTGFLTTCQARCRSDADCQTLVHSPDVYCANDPLSDFGCAGRNFDPAVHCCARKTCVNLQDCQGGGTCCQPSPALPAQCCLKDERCLATFGCVR
jgi:hypothetical protein